MTEPKLYQIALTMIYGIGDITGHKLLQIVGSPEEIFREKKRLLEKVPGIGAQTISEINSPEILRRAEKELIFIDENRIRMTFVSDDDYPYRLKECPDSPLLFYSKGNMNLNCKRILSIVGTRKVSWYGKDLTDKLIKELAALYPDILVVSGLAYGVDIQAHRSAYRNGLPTVGVLAHGLDRIYPYTHRQTAIEMCERGGLLTDFPSLTNPDRQNFIKRNRIVAGLADATVVIESANRGGSLITADIAFSYGRDVFAFPGRVGDENSEGCNHLIRRNKAGLITCAEDLVQALCWDAVVENSPVQTELFSVEREEDCPVMLLLRKNREMQINNLVQELAIPVHELSGILFELEMEGLIKVRPGNYYRIND